MHFLRAKMRVINARLLRRHTFLGRTSIYILNKKEICSQTQVRAISLVVMKARVRVVSPFMDGWLLC